MKAATLKGLALHTADDAGTAGPDAIFGWGLLNAKVAVEAIDNDATLSIISELDLTDGSSFSIDVVSDGTNDLIVSISWTDPAGTANGGTNSTTPALVNDLDIRVTQGASTYYPFRLTSITTNSNAGDNFVDPYEKIIISGASGSYTIDVTHKASLSGGNQNYSLIVTGIISDPPAVTNVAPTSLFEDRGKQITIDGSGLMGCSFDIGGVVGSVVSNNGSIAVVDFPAGNYTGGTLTVTNAAGTDNSESITINTRNTIPVVSGASVTSDNHPTILSAVTGLHAWYGTTAFNAGDLAGTKTINVNAGTYTDEVALNSELNPVSGNLLIIQNNSGDVVTVDATGNDYGFNLSTVDYVTLTGFTVETANLDNIYAQGDNVTIQYNKTSASVGGSGIKVETGTPFSITNNLAYANFMYGIEVLSANNTIKNNTADNNGGTYTPATGVPLFDFNVESGDFTGWSATASTWSVYDDAGYANSPTKSFMLPEVNGSLQYSSVDVTGYDNLTISCYARSDENHGGSMGNDDDLYGYYSFDNIDWTQEIFYINNDHNTYAQYSVTGVTPTSNTLYIKFTGRADAAEWWHVDDIVVSGDETAPASNTGAGLYVASVSATVENNIFVAKSGSNDYYALISPGNSVSSDYNTYYTTNTNLFDYNSATNNTGPLGGNESIVDPKFVGGGDYHIFSTEDSYHNGEWPPSTATAGTWTADASNSPALDGGNADAFANEPQSGGVINQGSYGNTTQASKSVAACTPPTTQAISFSATPHETSVDLSWTKGNGDRVLVLAHEAAVVDANPVSGVTYTDDANFSGTPDEIGTGNFVVYDANSNSPNVTVTGLTANTTYYFSIYEYLNTDVCYLTPGLTGDELTLPAQPSVITGSTTPCEGSSQVYSVTDVTGVTETWAFPAGWSITAGQSTNSVTVTVGATDGNVTCTPSNASGNGTARTLAVIVSNLPAASGNITGQATVCQGESGSGAYSVSAITDATSYVWAYSGTGETVSGTTNSETIDFATNATSGNLTVYGTNACGNGTVSSNYAITVNPLPAASGVISGTATVCKGDNAVAYSVVAISDATSYTWAYTGADITVTGGTTNSITIDFGAAATSGNLTVYATNACGDGTISSNYAITVNDCAGSYTISGTVKYDNAATTAINTQTVELYNTVPALVATTATDASGNYSFTGIADGDYTVTPDIGLAWNHATAMDVTLYKQHILTEISLTGLKLISGDVDGNTSLNTIDLTTDLQRIVAMTSSFAVGDWAYTSGAVTVSGADETVNISTICYGDANVSYFGAKSMQTIDIENDGIIYVNNGDAFELPVNLGNNLTDLASVTLSIPFNTEQFEITEVIFAQNNSNMLYHVGDGVVKIAYSTTSPTDFNSGDNLLIIRGVVNELSGTTNISNNIEGEFGDYSSNLLSGIIFAIPYLSPVSTEISNTSNEVFIFPNPASSYINVVNVNNSKIEIIDILGKVLITEEVDVYSKHINTESLTTGSYIVRIYKNNYST